MDQQPFDDIVQTLAQQGPEEALARLTEALKSAGDWHNLFDARMLHKKFALGLPVSRPASLQDVPEELRKEVEQTYLAAAREAGEGFLAAKDFANAWMYLKAIREPEKLAQALAALPDEMADYEQLDRLVQIALYQGLNPQKGLRWMLKGHGTCSTITALDQILPQLTPQQRADCAKLMVRHLHEELTETVRRQVEQRIPMLPPHESLTKLIAGRDWLFEGGAYHTDVSHLSSIVRFARSIEAPSEELELALQLSIYGSKLDKQLQYGGEPPFLDFYPAHIQFFNVLLDKQREAGLNFFREQLEAEPDEQDKPILAYVLVDLLMRCDQLGEAVEAAARYLKNLGEDVSISFDDLCAEAGRLDVLQRVRREQGNLVGYAAALLRGRESKG